MIIQAFDIFQIIADIIAIIVGFLQPIVMPIGSSIVQVVEFFLQIFPKNNWSIYIIVFIVLVITGGIVNILYPGDKPLNRDEEKLLPTVEGEIPLEEKTATEIESTESIDEFLLAEKEEMDFAEETNQDLKTKKEKKKKKSKKDKKEKKKDKTTKKEISEMKPLKKGKKPFDKELKSKKKDKKKMGEIQEEKAIEKEELSEIPVASEKKEVPSEVESTGIEGLSEKQKESEKEEKISEIESSENEKSYISKDDDKENNKRENKEKD